MTLRKLELTNLHTGEQLTYDLFQFARAILDYPLLQEDPHHAWCTELDRRHKRSLWLEPRHTFKSTVFTKAYPIWRLFREPDLRILIVNATAENAEAFAFCDPSLGAPLLIRPFPSGNGLFLSTFSFL
ncbi:MAG: hypothetical protein ACP5E9_09830 [Candidatus Methanospirareceae archaeon]